MLHVGRRTIQAALTAVVMGLAFATPATMPSASALAKIKCKQTAGAAAVDPIVHHDQQQPKAAVHTHQFFGNSAWLSKGNFARYKDLVGKSTNCENQADTAGYWVPQLVGPAGKPVPIQSFTAYYRPFSGIGGPDFGPGEVIHANTRLVATQYDWSCGQYSNTGPLPAIPSCAGQSGKPGHTLTAHVTFPTCWDGVRPGHHRTDVGDTRDNKHWRYKVRAPGGGWTCPAGFSHQMIQLRETIQYAYTGNGTDLHLTSDAMENTNDGQSMHGDFWNTWKMAGFRSMIANCVHQGGQFTAQECGG